MNLDQVFYPANENERLPRAGSREEHAVAACAPGRVPLFVLQVIIPGHVERVPVRATVLRAA